MNILVLVSVLNILVGCGGGDNTSDSGDINNGNILDNEKLSDGNNKHGFYGTNVVFGDTKIVGKWRETGRKYTFDYNFLADGTKIIVGGTLDGLSMDYGVSKNGTVLLDYFDEPHHIIKKRLDDCYDIEIRTKKGELLSRLFCKQR